LDSEFGLAWAGLSRIYQVQAGFGFAPIDEGFERGREAAQNAVRLAPDLAEGHVELGWVVMMHDWNWTAADASFRRALELAPGSANALGASAELARILSRHEALDLIRRATTLDPLSTIMHRRAALVLFGLGRLDEAASSFQLALDL